MFFGGVLEQATKTTRLIIIKSFSINTEKLAVGSWQLAAILKQLGF